MKKNNIKKINHHLNITGDQSQLDFANLIVGIDNRLFVDPSGLYASEDPFIQECHNIIKDYFDTILSLYSSGKKRQARRLFRDSGESNEVYLGKSKGIPIGKGNSAEILEAVFDEIERSNLLEDGVIKNIMDVFLHIENFGEDRLSDLIVSLIRKPLVDFTLNQCKKHGLDSVNMVPYSKKTWDRKTHKWIVFNSQLPLVDSKPLLLVPKTILVKKYLYSAENFLYDVVLTWRQEWHKDNETSLTRKRLNKKTNQYEVKKPSKTSVLREEVQHPKLRWKQYNLRISKDNPELLDKYRAKYNNVVKGSNHNRLTDKQLTEVINQGFKRFIESNK